MGGRHAKKGPVAVRLAVVLLVLLGMTGAGGAGLYFWVTGASGASEPATVEIPPGATMSEIAEILEERGVVRSALAFRLVARLRGGEAIQAGSYELRTNMRPQAALEALSAGPAPGETVTVTIPEGLRVDQVAERLAEAFPISAEEFLESAESGKHALPPYLPKRAGTVEGFLFPKTYELSPDAGVETLIGRLLGQFEEEVAGLNWSRAERLGLSPYEVVILASLIEREARVDGDRRKISSVIYNRIQRGMRLQIDATVQYALPEHKPRLTYADYEFESPYNTYLNDGLPPTPIASPGLASIKAALRPANTNFLFYILVDDEGHHAFTESYDEFLNIKNRVQG